MIQNGRKSLRKRSDAYGALKKHLAKQFPDDRGKYSDGKDKFIKDTLRMASRTE